MNELRLGCGGLMIEVRRGNSMDLEVDQREKEERTK